MSASCNSAAARLVRIFHPPDRLDTGLCVYWSEKPRPVRIFFARVSTSATFEGSTCSCRSASISAASLVSLARSSAEMSSSLCSYLGPCEFSSQGARSQVLSL